MPHNSHLAVEITKGDDNLDIWVDANNNGARDDDDVNIYVTAGGGFYTTSPTFKHALDEVIQTRIKALAVALLRKEGDLSKTEEALSELALELVVKAQDLNGAAAVIETAPVVTESVSWHAMAPALLAPEQIMHAAPAPIVAAPEAPAFEMQPQYHEPVLAAAQPAIVETQPVYHEPVLESAPQAFAYDLQSLPVLEATPTQATQKAIWVNLSNTQN